MRLYLVRHGEAVSEIIHGERPLSDKGRKDVVAVARFMLKAGIAVSVIYHSEKKRAKETAGLIKTTMSLQCEMKERDGLFPNDSPRPMAKEIFNACEELMIVGHLPFLARLTSLLILGDEDKRLVEFQAGSLVILEGDAAQNWRIVEYISPDIL